MTDKEFISNPGGWPSWPLLPMKKRDEGEHYPFRIGLIVETSEENWQSTIYLDVNLYRTKGLSKAEKKVYPTVDAMLADGWGID